MSGFPRGGGGGGAVASVFTRVGNVVATAGDYTAALVTNAADKGAAGQQAFTGELAAPDLLASGLTGAANQARLVGRTASGPPVAGTFAVGDVAVDALGREYLCTAAGTPGTWVLVNGAVVKANTDADTTFSNSVANNAIATLAVPTTVKAGDRLHALLMCELTNNSGAGVTYLFTVVLGATTLAVSNAINFASGANPFNFLVDIWVDVVATNAQRAAALLLVGNAIAGSGWGTTNSMLRSSYGTAAEDLTAAKNLIVQCQMGTAAALASVTCHATHLELVPKG